MHYYEPHTLREYFIVENMIYVLYTFSALFLLTGLLLLVTSILGRSFGAFLGSAAFGFGGGAAIAYVSWWPLAAGIVMVFLLRAAGLDPGYS
jgi:hypothetical protein